ncbi:amidohydrolase family protein [Sphingomonas sp.]|uniref:amidohydrolase family protein n=1 Tax=Sphingomonas sp. TaxID=28214 RepID=UPI000DB1762D|nr:amidohydrolase family protein [Sphingomonas sp.]PZU11006.1 MAG: amidohydrolase [Sphingomonas sp.]
MAEGVIGPGDVPTSPPSPRIVGGDGKPLLTIDIHAHAMFPEVEKRTAARPERAGEADFRLRTMGQDTVDYNREVMIPAAFPAMTQLARRLVDMDVMGVDIQLVSPSPNQYHYWAPVDLAAELVSIQNEGLAELCAGAPDRLRGLGMVALQHPALAVDQLRHAVKALGFRGVEISSVIAGKDLSDRAFDPFWTAAEELGAIIFIHPMGCSLDERLAPAYLSNHVGQPVEHAVALSHLIFGGVLDRHPGLKIVAAHGGGYLPAHLGRADHAWAQRRDARTCCHKPSSYLSRLHFDSLVFEAKDLALLIERVGIGNVVIGTDYPFDMGHYDIHGLVSALPGLDESDRAALLGGNLLKLMG